MKARLQNVITTPVTMLLAVSLLMISFSCDKKSSSTDVPELKRSMYHWKTTFNPTERERKFIAQHDVNRIYIHYFDVAYRDGVVQPEATVKFIQKPDSNLEVVPTIYLTIEALRAMQQEVQRYCYTYYADSICGERVYSYYAQKMLTRINVMNSHNHLKKAKEVQLDCDWTSTLRDDYFKFLTQFRCMLHNQGKKLSVTVRLHQLKDSVPPADKAVLMLYNTGNLMSPNTRNSILDENDVSPYVKSLKSYELPLDFAYPVFGWQVVYNNGKFHRLASPSEIIAEEKGVKVRRERADFSTILKVKSMVESKLWKANSSSTIIYHLDLQFLDLFTNEQIEAIFDRS